MSDNAGVFWVHLVGCTRFDGGWLEVRLENVSHTWGPGLLGLGASSLVSEAMMEGFEAEGSPFLVSH